MVVAAGIALAGCNTVSQAWQRPGGSTAQTNRDFDECKYDVGKSAGAAADPVNDLLQQCMSLRGYQRTAHFYVR